MADGPNLGSAYVNIVPKAKDIKNNIGNLLSDGSEGAEYILAKLKEKFII